MLQYVRLNGTAFFFNIFYDKLGRKILSHLKFTRKFISFFVQSDLTFVISSQDKLIEHAFTWF